MKKTLMLLILLIVSLLICGCKTQKEANNLSTESSFTSTAKENFQSQAESVPDDTLNSTQALNSSAASNITDSSKVQSSTTNQVVCIHSYRKEIIGMSCNTDGYMKYTCTKCGHSYNGETVSAGHDFSKYLCEGCGKIDPNSDVFWGMNAFLSKYGVPNGKGNMNCYPNDTAPLCLSNYIDQKQFMISLEDGSGSSISAYIDVDFTHFSYRNGSTYGYFEVKNSAFSLDNKIVFEEFGTNTENPIDQDVFATECSEKLRDLFNRAENEILIPKTGLSFNSFGFRI